MHQSKTPSLSQTIWPRWALRQLLTLPIVQTLLPVTFGYSLSSQAVVVMRQLRRWKRLWRRSLTRSNKRTSMGPSRSCWNGTTSALQSEEITSKGTRVSCEYISIKVPTWKKSGNLFNDPHNIYIYIYIKLTYMQRGILRYLIQIYASVFDIYIYIHAQTSKNGWGMKWEIEIYFYTQIFTLLIQETNFFQIAIGLYVSKLYLFLSWFKFITVGIHHIVCIYIYIYIYICSPMGVEHSGEGIYCCCLHNAKLFKWFEHSGIR